MGAPVLEYRPDLGMLVIGFLPGRALDNEDFADAGVMTRAADACRRLHAGPRFVNDFDMFARQAGYLASVRERGFPCRRRTTTMPTPGPTYGARWPRHPGRPCRATTTCWPPTTSTTASAVWLIDYEYSGNNDACFELGNTSTECSFTPEMTEAWTEAYFGSPTPADLARVRLQALCSAYGWSLWGFIQAATSPMDFDFHAWGMERFDKAEATFRGPDLATASRGGAPWLTFPTAPRS